MRWVALVFVALSMIVMTACGKPTPAGKSDQWKSYTDAQRGYSFQYPQDWTVEQVPEKNT